MIKDFVKTGDLKFHHYRFTGQLDMPRGVTLDAVAMELIETDVDWLVETGNGQQRLLPKNMFVKEELSNAK